MGNISRGGEKWGIYLNLWKNGGIYLEVETSGMYLDLWKNEEYI